MQRLSFTLTYSHSFSTHFTQLSIHFSTHSLTHLSIRTLRVASTAHLLNTSLTSQYFIYSFYSFIQSRIDNSFGSCYYVTMWLHWYYNAALCCTVLQFTVPRCSTTTLYCTLLTTALHSTALYCTALYCTLLHCTALYCSSINSYPRIPTPFLLTPTHPHSPPPLTPPHLRITTFTQYSLSLSFSPFSYHLLISSYRSYFVPNHSNLIPHHLNLTFSPVATSHISYPIT